MGLLTDLPYCIVIQMLGKQCYWARRGGNTNTHKQYIECIEILKMQFSKLSS